MQSLKRNLLAIALGFGIAASANANLVTLTSPNASATIESYGGGITVTLTNNIQNPTTNVDFLTAFSFTLGDAPGANFLASDYGQELVIRPDSTYVHFGETSTLWTLSSSANKLTLSNGQSSVQRAIIGFSDAGNYTSGAYSTQYAAQDGAPTFFESGATFNLVAAGVTASTTVTAATFYFGSKNVTSMGEITVGSSSNSVPDSGSTVALLGLGVSVLAGARRMKKGVGLSISSLVVAG